MIGDAIADLVGKVIDRVWEDPTEQAKAAQAIAEMKQRGEFKAIDAELERSRQQTEVNKVEAASDSLLKGGWRPATGWICACGLGWATIGVPVCNWILALNKITEPLPPVDTGALIGILLGMLGLGGYRTAEKFKGVAAK